MMAKFYKVFFEIYGKKMCTTIEAETAVVAKEVIRKNIKFHKIVPNVENKPSFDVPNFFKDIFG
jgi:hypothetical protein